MAYDNPSEGVQPEKPKPSAVVLKFKKRRFDGGSEIDLIQSIERQKDKPSQLSGNSQTVETADSRPDKHASRPELKSASNTLDIKPRTNKGQRPDMVASFAKFKSKKDSDVTPVVGGTVTPRKSRLKLMSEAVLLGPAKLVIGILGLMTTTCAVISFRYMNNMAMKDHSESILRECMKTLRSGAMDCLVSPGKLFKVAFSNLS